MQSFTAEERAWVRQQQLVALLAVGDHVTLRLNEGLRRCQVVGQDPVQAYYFLTVEGWPNEVASVQGAIGLRLPYEALHPLDESTRPFALRDVNVSPE